MGGVGGQEELRLLSEGVMRRDQVIFSVIASLLPFILAQHNPSILADVCPFLIISLN